MLYHSFSNIMREDDTVHQCPIFPEMSLAGHAEKLHFTLKNEMPTGEQSQQVAETKFIIKYFPLTAIYLPSL